MQSYKMWINGKWVEAESGKIYKVVNPATEEEIGLVPLGDKTDVAKAVEAARKAQPIWAKKTQEERSKILYQVATSAEKRLKEIAELDVLDHGSPLDLANIFARRIPTHFRSAADIGKTIMEQGKYKKSSDVLAYLQHEPIGVVAIIVPWNVPLMVGLKIAAALTCGNTCVVKPPSVCSLSALQIGEILAEHDIPPGVVNIITGPGNSVGESLASHPDVDMVAFTGSSETGQAIMSAASKTAKRLYLELGGNNPFIVLDDADLDAAIQKAIFATAHKLIRVIFGMLSQRTHFNVEEAL